MDEERYEDLAEFEAKDWTVKEFIEWLQMWLTEEELNMPFYVDGVNAGRYNLYLGDTFIQNGDEEARSLRTVQMSM